MLWAWDEENKYLGVGSQDMTNYYLFVRPPGEWLKRVRSRVKIVQRWRHPVSGLEMHIDEMVHIIYQHTPITDIQSNSETRSETKTEAYIYPLRPLRVAPYLMPYLYLMYSFLQITDGTITRDDFWETIQTTNQSENPLDYLIAGMCDASDPIFTDIETLFNKEPTLDTLVNRFACLTKVEGNIKPVNFATADSNACWNDDQVHAVIIKMLHNKYQLFLKYTLEDDSHLYFTVSGTNISTFDPEMYSVKELIRGREGIIISFEERNNLVKNSWMRIDTIHRRANPNRPVLVFELDDDGIPTKKRTCAMRTLLLTVNDFLVSYHPKNCRFPAAEIWSEEDNSFLAMGTSDSCDKIQDINDKAPRKAIAWQLRQLVWREVDPDVVYKPVLIHRSPKWTFRNLREKMLAPDFESYDADEWMFYTSDDLVTMNIMPDEMLDKKIDEIPLTGLVLARREDHPIQ